MKRSEKNWINAYHMSAFIYLWSENSFMRLNWKWNSIFRQRCQSTALCILFGQNLQRQLTPLVDFPEMSIICTSIDRIIMDGWFSHPKIIFNRIVSTEHMNLMREHRYHTHKLASFCNIEQKLKSHEGDYTCVEKKKSGKRHRQIVVWTECTMFVDCIDH